MRPLHDGRHHVGDFTECTLDGAPEALGEQLHLPDLVDDEDDRLSHPCLFQRSLDLCRSHRLEALEIDSIAADAMGTSEPDRGQGAPRARDGLDAEPRSSAPLPDFLGPEPPEVMARLSQPTHDAADDRRFSTAGPTGYQQVSRHRSIALRASLAVTAA